MSPTYINPTDPAEKVVAAGRSTTDVSPLFAPLNICGLSIANRIVMAPMTRSFCPGGVPDEAVATYYRRRAEGGTGLIITEAIGTDHPASIGDTGLGETDIPIIHTAAAAAGWKHVVDTVHAAGGKIIPQFWHQGPCKVPGTGLHPDVPGFTPSGTYGPTDRVTSITPEYMAKLAVPLPIPSDAEIVEVIESFARGARAAKAAGFDGFALHGAHGYLLDAFLWDETNSRSDRWGGSRRNRVRFVEEIVKAVRRELGESLPIIFRFSQWKQQDFKAKIAQTPQQLEEILGPLADAGVDLFDASVRYFNPPAFADSDLSLAGWAKKLTGKLSSAVGGIGIGKGMYETLENGTASVDNLDVVMKRFNAGECDVISVGRALISDPEWALKVRNNLPFNDFDASTLYKLV